ncbi:MAG: DNA polymerase III subunit delta' [Phycisphaerae bacterium]|jgi:DNA polymerase-3 subunit delta'
MNLTEIFCQDRAVDSLQRAFAASKVPHAVIFAGPEGVGKFTTAKCWAQLLLCASPVKKDNAFIHCGKCSSCTAFETDSHPDFHYIYKELLKFSRDAENRKRTPIDLPIDVVREFILEKVSIKSVLSASKVFVISESERLNTASQNALLKVLEEPPGKSFIILLCTKIDNLLPTTKSRCQIVQFGSLSDEKIIAHLVAGGIDKNQAKFWAGFTAGSIGQAELFSKLEPSFYDIKKQAVRRFADLKITDAVDFAQWISSTASALTESLEKLRPDTSKSDINRQTKKAFVQIFVSVLSDAMRADFADKGKIVHFDQADCVGKLAQRYDCRRCADLIEACFETGRFIDASVNEKLLFEHLLLSLANSGIMRG